MVKFTYNNSKNANTDHILIKLNYGYNPQVLFKDVYNISLKSFLSIRLTTELKKLINIYCQNFLYA